jgi:hypothetical protein
MIIDNQKKAVQLKIQKSVALLLLVVAFGLMYFTDIVADGIIGLTRDQVAILVVISFIIYFLLHILRNQYYIYYSDTGDEFILRYFSLRPLTDKKHSIEFRKSEFHKFEITRPFLKLNESIIIYRKTPKGIAKYPPVSITALGKPEKEKLIASLQRLAGTGQPET